MTLNSTLAAGVGAVVVVAARLPPLLLLRLLQSFVVAVAVAAVVRPKDVACIRLTCCCSRMT